MAYISVRQSWGRRVGIQSVQKGTLDVLNIGLHIINRIKDKLWQINPLSVYLNPRIFIVRYITTPLISFDFSKNDRYSMLYETR